ncbi:MAG TPA: serine hydrolase domain-containing protein [Chryseosolibacter sp.]
MHRLFAVVSILFLGLQTPPENRAHAQGSTQEQYNIISHSLMKLPANVQFSVALVENGKVTFIEAKREKDTVVILQNRDRVFEIGSISKVFTSTLLAESVLQGRVSLDKNFDEGLGVNIKDNTRISFRQLANHTSGLPRLPTNLILFAVDPANPYRDYDETKLREYLSTQLKVAQEPGTKYEYSNLAVGLLGYVLSKIEMKSYEELLQQRIVKKYEMRNSTTERSKVENKLVKGVGVDGKEVSNWDLGVLVGAGGILSTAEDLSKFAVAQFDESNKVLALTREKTFDVNETMAIGLGWHILKRDGGEVFNHNGGTGGYRSSMSIDIKNKRSVIVLSNLTAFHSESKSIDTVCGDLLKTLK